MDEDKLDKALDEERSLCYKEVILCNVIQIVAAVDQCVDLDLKKEEVQQLLLKLLRVTKITYEDVKDIGEALMIGALKLANVVCEDDNERTRKWCEMVERGQPD